MSVELENFESEFAGSIDEIVDSLPVHTKGLSPEASRIESVALEIDPAHEMSSCVAALFKSKLTKDQIVDLLNEYSLWLYDVKRFFLRTWGPHQGGAILAAYGQRVLSQAIEAQSRNSATKILARAKGEIERHSCFPALTYSDGN